MANAEDDDIKVGDEVILLGRDLQGPQIMPEDLAAWAGTNEYEVLTNISARARWFISDDAGRRNAC